MNKEAVIQVLEETRERLKSDGNDYLYSKWKTDSEAEAELTYWIKRINEESLRSTVTLESLFGPTGAIQEVSESSGWAEEFLDLSTRFDKAIKRGSIKAE